MITPEIPEELIEKMTRAYWNIAPAADYDVRASKPVEEVKAAVRDNLTVALSAVYSDIRRQAFEEALREAAYDLRQWESAEAHMGQEDCEGPHGATAAYRLFESAIEDPAQWLLDRADSIVRSLAGEGYL